MELGVLLSRLYFILLGVPVTLSISVLAFLFGLALGIPFAFIREYLSKPYQLGVDVFEKVLRGIPGILLMLLFYFGIGCGAGIKPFDNPFVAVLFALGLRSGANQSQIFRGAIRSVGESQMVAARSTGFPLWKAIFFVIAPQTFIVATPGLGNEYALLIKGSAYTYIVGILEVMKRAAIVRVATLDLVFPYLASAFIYILLTFPIATYLDIWGTRKKKQLGL